jgi:hypothetical protein
MKPSLIALFAIALLAGCASAPSNRSAAYVVLPPSAQSSREITWQPAETDIADLERKLSALFSNPDARIAGLPDGIPPFPISEYVVRYSGTGPEDSRYILGLAVHRNTVEREKFLSPTASKPTVQTNDGGQHFSVMYDAEKDYIVAVGFNAPL